jgi:S1-C subfamily serine protease
MPLTLGFSFSVASGQEGVAPLSNLKLPDGLVPDFGIAEINRLGGGLLQFQEDKLKVAPFEKSRALTADLYEKVAPAICVVQHQHGFGTGFFVHADSWLLTNNHVISQAFPDPKTGALMVYIHLGGLNKDGAMELTQRKLPAFVYKTSPEKDLALVRLLQQPAKKLRLLSLAKTKAKVGTECVVIGNPSVGVLWTARDGRVSGIGEYPDERVDTFLKDVWAKGVGPDKQIKGALARVTPRKILITNIGIAPGDSGGPLVNDTGEVIGVNFAYPRFQDKDFTAFAYHVHVDEVSNFIGDLAEQPKVPGLYLPSPYPPFPFYALQDLDKDGKPDSIAVSDRQGGQLKGVLFDLTQSNPKFPQPELYQAVRKGAWKFQFGMYLAPLRAFYDTTNSGKIDLILTVDPANPQKAGAVLRRTEKGWVAEPGNGRALRDPTNFQDPALQKMCENLLKKL